MLVRALAFYLWKADTSVPFSFGHQAGDICNVLTNGKAAAIGEGGMVRGSRHNAW